MDDQLRDMIREEMDEQTESLQVAPTMEELEDKKPEEGSELTYSQEYYIMNR